MVFLKALIPNAILKIIRPVYHGALAVLAAGYFRNPSGKMVVIGITGTAGKSTTAAMLSFILNYTNNHEGGGKRSSTNYKCGYMTTVNFFDGDRDYINKHGLSMPGGPKLQKQLRQMLDNGCKYAVVECTSEGLAQNRHLGIKFDAALFTNLSPAHIEAHGSFEKYKEAKSKLFTRISTNNSKRIFTKPMIGVNLDDGNAEYFLGFGAPRKFGVTFGARKSAQAQKVYEAVKSDGGFVLDNQNFKVKLPGEFNKYNALLAAACANMLGVDLKTAAEAISLFLGIRGRMEPVENTRGIKIYVDYGCEPASFRAALEAASKIGHIKLIHVFGSTGGHRDISKRFDFGRTSARIADVIIVTNDDVYDTDPEEIATHIEEGIGSVDPNERKAKIIKRILDRKAAIGEALKIAEPGDLVLITGKGSEQFLVLPGNRRIEWDETSVVKETLNSLK